MHVNLVSRATMEFSAFASDSSVASQEAASPTAKRTKVRDDDELFKVDPIDVIAARTTPWVAAKNSKKRKTPDMDWRAEYPWIKFVYGNAEKTGPIVGILCDWCREAAATKHRADVKLLFQRSKMGFINNPLTNWEKAGERLYKHEFGEKAPNQAKYHGSTGKAKLRTLMMDMVHSSTHMHWRSEYLKRERVERSGKDIQTCLTLSGATSSEDNRRAVGIMMRTLLKLIQQKASPFYRFKREIEYLRLLQVPTVGRLANRYTSVQAIMSFTKALHLTVLYGIYVEMDSACEEEEELSFGVLVDLASTSRTREWLAVCIRYVSASPEGEVCERLLKMCQSDRKTGLAVMTSMAEAVAWFNAKMNELCKCCPFLFGSKGPKKLSFEHCSSYGSDGGGGTHSKYISANCRIREYNARTTDWWCGSHRVQLASKHASTTNRFMRDHYDATKKLQRLLTMSSEVDGMFKRSQCAILNIPYDRAISFCDVPMHKWETENDCLAKEAKLHNVIATAMVDIRDKAKDPNSRQFTTHYLCELVVKPIRILYVAMKRDVLAIAVTLIRKTEKTGIELTEYQRAVDRGLTQIRRLQDVDGPLLAKAKEAIRGGEFKDFLLPNDESIEDLFRQADEQRDVLVQAFEDQISSYLSSDNREIVKAFELLSMDKMAVEVQNEAEVDDYCSEQETALVKFYCEPVSYTARWPEKKGEVITAQSMGTEEELRDQLSDLKHQMYQFAKLPSEKRRTRDILLRLIKANVPCVRKKWLTRKIIKSYLELPLSTSGVECVFSAVKLTDTRLCMRRKERTTNQYLSIIMESEPFESFDIDLAVTIWEKLVSRRLALAVGARGVSHATPVLRSMAKKAAGRDSKFERRMRLLKKSLPQPCLPLEGEDSMEDPIVLERDDWFGGDDDDVFHGFAEEDIEMLRLSDEELEDDEDMIQWDDFEGYEEGDVLLSGAEESLQ